MPRLDKEMQRARPEKDLGFGLQKTEQSSKNLFMLHTDQEQILGLLINIDIFSNQNSSRQQEIDYLLQ